MLGRRMGKHIQVHRRSNEHGSFHREVGSYQHVVGYAVRHLADGRRRSRGNDHCVGPQSEVDMAVPRSVALRKNSLMTGLLVSAESVMGVINSFPAGVMTICTSAPFLSGLVSVRQPCTQQCYPLFPIRFSFLSSFHQIAFA